MQQVNHLNINPDATHKQARKSGWKEGGFFLASLLLLCHFSQSADGASHSCAVASAVAKKIKQKPSTPQVTYFSVQAPPAMVFPQEVQCQIPTACRLKRNLPHQWQKCFAFFEISIFFTLIAKRDLMEVDEENDFTVSSN